MKKEQYKTKDKSNTNKLQFKKNKFMNLKQID